MAAIQQLSVFLENNTGRLNKIMEVIGKANVRIIAAMVADTSEYGILRLITTNMDGAFMALKDNNISANLSEVIALVSDSDADSCFSKLKYFSADGISVEYMYSFAVDGKVILILRVNDMEGALGVISKNRLETLTSEELEAFAEPR